MTVHTHTHTHTHTHHTHTHTHTHTQVGPFSEGPFVQLPDSNEDSNEKDVVTHPHCRTYCIGLSYNNQIQDR